LRAVNWRFRARGPDFRLPLLPRAAVTVYRIPRIGDGDGRSRGRPAVLRAGRRDRHRQAVGDGHDQGAERDPQGRPGAGDQGVRHYPPPAAGDGGLAALPPGRAGRDGGDQRLLEAGVLPAGAGGLRVPALPGVAGQGAAGAAEDRQAGLGLAGEGHRARDAGGQLRAAGGDPPAPHPYPLPAQARAGADRGEAALREAAGGRAPEAVERGQRRPRGLRPGHAGRAHRRRAEPRRAGADGQGPDAPQDRPAGGGPGLLVLHRRARVHPADDAGEHRPLRCPDRRAGREDRGPVRTV
jgi:hypothetical protein